MVIISILLNIVTIILRIFIPKDNKLIVISGYRFADNCKYLFLEYCEKYADSFKMYWITRDNTIFDELEKNNMPVVKARTMKSIWLHLRAKYHIMDQRNDLLSGLSITATRINLWHGIPFKKIWRASSSDKLKTLSSLLGDFIYDNLSKIISLGGWKDFRLCVPSDYVLDNHFAQCISTRQIKMAIKCQYPRISFLLGGISNMKANKFMEIVKSIKYKGSKVYIYMPTFRDTQNFPLLGENNEENREIFYKKLSEENLYLLVKPHPADKTFITIKHPNIIMMPSDMDVYPLLTLSDALITDYSSIFFDYSVMGKPIIFYIFDYEYYKNQDRGLLFSIDDIDIGKKTYNLEELFYAMSHLDEISIGKIEKFSSQIVDRTFPSLNELLAKQKLTQ